MPLIKRKSQKAFEHNLKAEMHAGKPQDQSLAIAYSVKRRAKKAAGGSVQSGSRDMNYAEGGMAYKNDSAKSQQRPMPEEQDNDSMEVSRNSGDKAPHNDSWTDRPELKQSRQGLKTTKLKHPKMVPSNAFSTRLRDEEDELQRSEAPDSPKEQPASWMNEMDADKSGPESKDLKLKRMAKGGMSGSHDEDEAEHADLSSHVSREYGAGPEEDEVEHPADLEEDDDQMRLPVDEYMASHFAEGGSIDEDEAMLDHAASVAAAVMARRKKRMMAMGGEILDDENHHEINSHGSIHAHPEDDQVDLSRNADEDANEEDYASYEALRKENYSESEGLRKLDQPMDSNRHGDNREMDAENEHDRSLVSRIRKKMKKRSPITE